MKGPRASRKLVRLLPVVALLGLALAPLEARAGSGLVKLTGCTTISKSGTYLLGVNISKTGDCFKIQTDLVVFDLGGLALTGKGSGAAITDNGNSVQGNTIGLRPDAQAKIPNATGVLVNGTSNLIGGSTAGLGNVITGNTGDGVRIQTCVSAAAGACEIDL